MGELSTKKLVAGFNKAFINSNDESDPIYSPGLISNSHGRKVLTAIDREMKSCDDMFISVAFITMGGIAPLLGTLKDMEQQNIHGRILTTDYLMFSDPRALDKLSSLRNLEVRVFKTGDNNIGFHTKGYMFHNGDNLRIIIGSSNLTQDAITKNHEWNTRLVSSTDGEYAKEIETVFNELWESSVCYKEYRDEYTELYENCRKEREDLTNLTRTLNLSYSKVLEPNAMQEEFSLNIERLIRSGQKRAMLISATGTGKTYASAFAIRKLFSENILKGKKALFLSHREQINRQALSSYKRIFGRHVPMDLLSGTHNDLVNAKSAHFLFSTMNMMAKAEIREHFRPDEFSVIVLDECHRSGAESYQKIINYFKPELLLGMSASPERMDGFDVFSLFDHNIACEVRLQQALENDMLCPFHYFGITDLEVDGKSLDDLTKFRKLVSDKRVEYIIERAEYYGYSGDRVKGLIFCSRKEEAKELSDKFNATGKYNTVMLSGDDSQEYRENAIERLVSSDRRDRLDYIFTVDIFNEGVDIPEINQVILLRPTESPIIFVQQLGRGLRIAEGKEYVVILDFIGNYQTNYMIPIALSGDRSGNKDNIRRSLIEGNNMIKGASTIYFDPISRDRIYKSIDTADLNQIKLLKKEYQQLKYKLGRIPYLSEFDALGELDPMRIIQKKGSYQAFLRDCEPDFKMEWSDKQYQILEFISTKFASGMRLHELVLLKSLINSPISAENWTKALDTEYGVKMDTPTRVNAIAVLSGGFFRGNKFAIKLIEEKDGIINLSEQFSLALKDKDYLAAVKELIDFGIYRNGRDYSKPYGNTHFTLYKKYTYTEVCWLLNWRKEEVSLNIGGYKYDSFSKTYPVFINYEKEDDITATTRYEDRFTDPSTLTAISKSRRTIESDDVQNAIHAVERDILMPLFVRKNKDDKVSKEFYFLGTMKHNGHLLPFIMDDTDNVTAVEIGYKLDTPIESNLYEYITEQSI
ncbi:MAG: DEAD/DEAH box helicase [Bacteroidales bacterium]|nr:DEAD/DEAH box helicase [Bacteroidales bacterium]